MLRATALAAHSRRRARARLIACLAAALACGAPAPPPTDQPTDQASTDHRAIDQLLDAWHAAAAASDERAYFDALAADAVFIGTDASERWTKDEFYTYAHPHFVAERGWVMRASRRALVVHGDLAWFDEDLEARNLGPSRGSGVLLRGDDGAWKIKHYVLSTTIPNDDLPIVKRLLESNARRRSPPAAPPLTGPRLKILGVAQDGGVPHASCRCERCEAARRDPSRAHMVASLALIIPTDGVDAVHLIDATPDLARQLELLPTAPARDRPGVDRRPLASIFLTHAHIGHYLGLAQLGFEVMHTSGTLVRASPRMIDFLRDNAPWEQLIRLGEIMPEPLTPEAGAQLGDVQIRPVVVPHRDEYTDTVGYRLQGPRQTVLYIPDAEPWERWSDAFDAALEGVDVALLDATFYAADELPGRPIESLGHPLVPSTIERLRGRIDRGALRVVLIHLNHTNPLLDPRSPESQSTREAGVHVAAEGEEIDL
jgi:pyrroloquinoline quinone biosynthesis protein B